MTPMNEVTRILSGIEAGDPHDAAQLLLTITNTTTVNTDTLVTRGVVMLLGKPCGLLLLSESGEKL
jgi:hypothetical protein